MTDKQVITFSVDYGDGTNFTSKFSHTEEKARMLNATYYLLDDSQDDKFPINKSSYDHMQGQYIILMERFNELGAAYSDLLKVKELKED